MTKKIFIPLLLLILMFISCDTNPKFPAGSLEVVSVSPNTGLVAGVATEFTIVVNYSLVDCSGIILTGFNKDSTIYSYNYSDAGTVVNEGSGTVTIKTTAIPKDWGVDGDFGVYVLLYQSPYSINSERFGGEIISLYFL